MITAEELRELLPLMETAWVEKTISVSKDKKFGEAICAFANDLIDRKAPGYLLIGVHDDGTIEPNANITEQTVQTILAFRNNGTITPRPSITTQIFPFEEGKVLVAEIAPSLYPPVRYKNKVCIRAGERKGYATAEEERRLSEKRISQARTYDLRPCLGSQKEDLDLNYIQQTYIPLSVARAVLIENGRTLEEQLSSIRMYDRQHDVPNNAAVLLFGREINTIKDYFPGAYIQYVRFNGNDLLATPVSNHQIEGNIVQQLEGVERFLQSIIRRHQKEITAPQTYNYPLITLLELLYNAIIHRDYESNAPIKFYQFDDRIEIQNPGGLYGSVNPSNFPYANDYRNPVLAEAALKLGYVQRFNVGITKAKAALQNNGSPEPIFILEQPSHFSVTISIHEDHYTI